MSFSCKLRRGGDCADRSAGLLALQLKALGHPVRLQILQCLHDRSACCCGEICANLPLAQSTISQHLDLMRRAGLVEFTPDGNRSRYSLNRQAIAELSSAIGELALSARQTPQELAT